MGKYNREDYLENREKLIKRSSKWNKEDMILKRQLILKHYGGKCECCGETHEEFLSVDHINCDGKIHRTRFSGCQFYTWIIKSGFPKDLRILCYNCNLSLGHRGYCPHKKNSRSI